MSFFKKIGKSIADFFVNLWNVICNKVKDAKAAIKENPRVILEKTRTITFALIIFVMAFAGIYFILQADQQLKKEMWKVYREIKNMNVVDKETGEKVYEVSQAVILGQSKALCLIIAILLSFGSSIVSAFSETKKENKILVYALKGIALVLAIGFIIFVAKFDTTYLTAKGIKTFEEFKVLAIILGSLGAGLIATNIVSNAVLGIEE